MAVSDFEENAWLQKNLELLNLLNKYSSKKLMKFHWIKWKSI